MSIACVMFLVKHFKVIKWPYGLGVLPEGLTLCLKGGDLALQVCPTSGRVRACMGQGGYSLNARCPDFCPLAQKFGVQLAKVRLQADDALIDSPHFGRRQTVIGPCRGQQDSQHEGGDLQNFLTMRISNTTPARCASGGTWKVG